LAGFSHRGRKVLCKRDWGGDPDLTTAHGQNGIYLQDYSEGKVSLLGQAEAQARAVLDVILQVKRPGVHDYLIDELSSRIVSDDNAYFGK
jgi:hypothetical protein